MLNNEKLKWCDACSHEVYLDHDVNHMTEYEEHLWINLLNDDDVNLERIYNRLKIMFKFGGKR